MFGGSSYDMRRERERERDREEERERDIEREREREAPQSNWPSVEDVIFVKRGPVSFPYLSKYAAPKSPLLKIEWKRRLKQNLLKFPPMKGRRRSMINVI
jgi:hypothetical protein